MVQAAGEIEVALGQLDDRAVGRAGREESLLPGRVVVVLADHPLAGGASLDDASGQLLDDEGDVVDALAARRSA